MNASKKRTASGKMESAGYYVKVRVSYNPDAQGYTASVDTGWEDDGEKGICLSVSGVSVHGLVSFAGCVHSLIGRDARQLLADCVRKLGADVLEDYYTV